MYQYTWIQWLFFFFFYCFFGWCFESAYVSIRKKRWVNRGFIRGPFLPLYGTGGLMMLVVSMPFQDNIFLTYLAGCVGATALEYVTGAVMEALFKVRYWDYSDQKFQFQGYICLSSSLAWGGLTILMTHVVHRPVEKLALWMPEWLLTLITMAAALYFTVDFTLSFQAAMDLRDVLIKMEQAKREMARMQKRLDVLLAVADETVENLRRETREELDLRREELFLQKEEISWRLDTLEEDLENRFARIREKLSVSELLSERREELRELRQRFSVRKEKTELRQFVENMMRRRLILGNPSMMSRKFAESLEELRQYVLEYRNKNKDEE